MEPQELEEAAEKARAPEEKRVALTMAIVAVLLALVTMLGHRAHTREVVLQTETNDQWTYYQAKNSRAQMYAADSKLASLLGAAKPSVALAFDAQAEHERSGAEQIRKAAEALEARTQATEKEATHFDLGEILFEISLVLCSVTLLSGTMLYWRLSFLTSAIALIITLLGFARLA